MYTYQYLQSDFIADSNISQLHSLQASVAALALVSGDIISISTNDVGTNRTFEFTFSAELSYDDKAAVDNLVITYIDPFDGVLCSIKDIKSPGTNGGSFIQDIWTTRDLNVIEGNVSFATLSNNIVTVDAGIYIIVVKAPAVNVENHQIRLRNITDSTYSLGLNASSSNNNVSLSTINDQFEFITPVSFDIQHICSKTVSSIGFGSATGYATNEIYTTIFIQKMN